MDIIMSILFLLFPILIAVIYTKLRDSDYFNIFFLPTALIYLKVLYSSVEFLKTTESNIPMICMIIGILIIPYYLGYLFIKKMYNQKWRG